MSSTEPSITRRPADIPSQPIESGLILVEIDYHSRLYSAYSDDEMKSARTLVSDTYHTLVEYHGGKPYCWDRDGGAFLFPIESNDSFDNCCLTAFQMLEMVPGLIEDIRSSAERDCPIEVRISCDVGFVAHGTEELSDPDEFIHRLMKHKRQVGAANRVTITERLYRPLTPELKSRFETRKYSRELEVDLHRTPPLVENPRASDRTYTITRGAPVDAGPLRPGAVATPGKKRLAAPERVRALVRRVGPWPLGSVALAVVLLAGFVVVSAVHPSAPRAVDPAVPPPLPPAPSWAALARSEDWLAWRKHVHETLSARATEETVGEALQRPPALPHSSPAALRRDLAMADVLLSYDGVGKVLKNRLGIDEHFLGTGMSNPVNAADYGLASVHEYLIPNLRDDHAQVWTRKFNPFILDLEKRVRDLIEEETEEDETKQKLKQVIISRVQAKEPGAVVIRFARLDMNWYKGTVGRPASVRAFASDLAEVWNMKVKAAADLSGYHFSGGDTFFVWVFVPEHREEAVPATWGQVLEHLPKWMDEAKTKVLSEK
jgi:hypothetical protein